MTEHRMKVSSEYYHGYHTGMRSSYVTKDNGQYRIGDVVTIMEWDFKKGCQKTHGDYQLDAMNIPNECHFTIILILNDKDAEGIKEGYCILELGIIRRGHDNG